MLERYLYFYIVILKCYQTAIQYIGNVTLSLVVTPRHDKKLDMPFSGFMQNTALDNNNKYLLKLDAFVSIYVVLYNSKNIILSFSAFMPSLSTFQYMVGPFSPYAKLPPLKALQQTVS